MSAADLRAPDSAKPLEGDDIAQGVCAVLSQDGQAIGTAVCVSPQGYLITCNHVLENRYFQKEEISVLCGGVRRVAVWEYGDGSTDLAVLRLPDAAAPKRRFPLCDLGNHYRGFRFDGWGYPGETKIKKADGLTITNYSESEMEYQIGNAQGIMPGFSGGPILWQSRLVVGIIRANYVNASGNNVGDSIGISVSRILRSLPDFTRFFCMEPREMLSGGDNAERRFDGPFYLDENGLLTVTDMGKADGNPPWFDLKQNIRDITIRDGVTEIPDFAFCGCAALRSVSVPGSVSRIGTGTFENCPMLEEARLADGVRKIGAWGFAGCTSLPTINLPESVTEIGAFAFQKCARLRRIRIPKGVVKLRKNVFAQCASLETVEIPYGVCRIDEEAFSDCSSLRPFVIPATVRFIASTAFRETGLSESQLRNSTGVPIVKLIF